MKLNYKPLGKYIKPVTRNNDLGDLPLMRLSVSKLFSLVPSKYSEIVNRDKNIKFEEKMNALKSEFAELLKTEEASKKDTMKDFENLDYKIELS